MSSPLTSNTGQLPHPAYRPDIDGLRAIAVLAVVVYHAFPAILPGGFVGVDIFFVISGYLISTIIAGGLQTGRFSFAVFYQRRVKRIFPALLLVLSATIVAGRYILLSDEYTELGKQVAGGAGFVSNFLLWSGSGYFDSAAETKPLLHLWSLAIEEQFYIFWPLLLWVAYRWRLNFYVMAGVIAALSMALNLALVTDHPVAAFYSPLSRSWELLAGALLAFATLRRGAPLGGARASWLSLLGFGLLIVGLATCSNLRPFPGWQALLPVGGAVLLIGAGSQAWINRRLLAHPVMVWFGLISFPLYLWHWPLLVFPRIVRGGVTQPPAVTVLLMLLAVLLAWLTVRCIERPVRTGVSRLQAPVLAGLMLAVGAGGFVTYQKQGLIFGRQQNLAMSDADMTAERQRYWDGSLVSNYSAGKPKVLIYGDSQAYDIYKALSNDREIGLQLFKTSHQCAAFFSLAGGEPEVVRDQCQREFDKLLNSEELKTADTLIYTHLWSESTDPVKGYKIGAELLRAKNPALKILFFGHKPLLGPVWGASINAITRKHQSPIGMNKYLDGIKNISDEGHVQRMAQLANSQFVDVQQIFCDGGCQFYVDGNYSYFDFDHWTEAGARIFYERLIKTDVYHEIKSPAPRAAVSYHQQ
ncbi:acyltransferase family protein [Duganella levis]|uniref:Acyltransferase family protein n=1 Tax=Duganella levis TaxID=2692169 RepID=A0ABW9VU45_9BURK|nr:acyltransferase family protein [Duganella levis]MYN25144.1 acyltransferase family protein [Duganella levis]